MNMATQSVCVTVIYLILLLVIGYLSYRKTASTPEDYFMGSRSFGTFVVAMSIFATNMTSVYMIGTPGFAYRAGIGIFGYMAVSAIMVVGFLVATIGLRCWMLGKAYGYITPGEMFSDRLESNSVNLVYFIFFTVFTTAYLITAVIGAGIALETLTEGLIGYPIGCLAILATTLVYTSLGGMRGTAWTNVLQGSMFLCISILAFFVIAAKNGGFGTMTERVMAEAPQLFQREGLISWKRYFSWALICPVAAIAYPHVLMRIMTASSSRGVRNYTWLYGVLIFIGFIPVIYIGLWGRILFPGLEGNATDGILPMMMVLYATDWLDWVQLGFMPIVPLLVFNVLLLIAVSKVTRKPSREAVEKWFGLFDVFGRRPKEDIRKILDQIGGRRDMIEGNWIRVEGVDDGI